MKLKPTKPGVLAIIFWVLSFILAFRIQPGSRYIWLPDTLLLLGFSPLLIGCRARWLWLGFGIGNMVIGWAIALSTVVPEASLAPYHVVEIKKHLELYHPLIVWLLIGMLSTIIGTILLFISLILWLFKKLKLRTNA